MPATATVAKADLLAPGATVGRYQLLRRLAIGGMAELHLACATGAAGFQKVVVLKRVLPHLAADGEFVRMFLDEARLAAHLDHPNVVQVIDSGEAAGEFFYVMEYVHGRNARELLGAASHAGGMPLGVALTIAIGVAAALEHAHKRVDLEGRPMELVHRDVSPANVLISYDGAIKLTDFGIAKAATRSHETVAGMMKGKIGYMSPEQCRGDVVDARSDVFSLGVVLFELTTCERLFFADSDFAVLNKVVGGRFDRPSQRVADYPPALEQIVLRALATTPDERYGGADELRRALEGFAHEHGVRWGTELVAGWLRERFGTPPYPRVELRPPSMGELMETAPTLVLVDDEPSTVRVDEVASVSASLRRRGPGRAIAALAAVAGVAAVSWTMRDPEPAAASQRDAVAPTSERAEASSEPTVVTPTIAAPVPPATAGASTQVMPASAPLLREAAVEPTTQARASEPTHDGGKSRGRARKRGKPTAAPREPAPTRDLNALYPDKG